MNNLTANTPRLSYFEALNKWGGLTDVAVGGFGRSIEDRIVKLVSAGATEESLKLFWADVKHLTWASTFGVSPWKTASMLGSALEARDLGSGFDAVGSKYIEPFLASLENQRIQNIASNAGLKPFRVMLLQKPGDQGRLAFDCDAEDEYHAAEQAENAYSGCVVLKCTWYECSDQEFNEKQA